MISRKRKIFAFFMFGLISSVLFCLRLGEKPTYAAPAVDIQKSIMDKAIYQGVYKCYTTTGMLKPSMNLGDYQNMGSLMGENAHNADFVNLVSGGHDNSMTRITGKSGLRYNEKDDSLSCAQLLSGGTNAGHGSNNQGILEATGHSAPKRDSVEEVVQFYKGMGYEVNGVSNGNATCYSVVFNKGNTPLKSGNKICQKEDGSMYPEPKIVAVAGGENDFVFDVDSSGEKVCLKFKNGESEESRCGKLVDRSGNSANKLDQSTLTSTIKNNICRDGGRSGICVVGDSSAGGSAVAYKFSDIVDNVSEQGSLNDYHANFPGYPQHGSAATAARVAIDYLSEGQMGEDLGLSKAEKRILYQEYLTGFYEYEVDCEAEHIDADSVWWFDGASGEIKQCSISRVGNSPERKVHAVDDAGMFEGEIDANGIIKFLEDTKDDFSPEELTEMSDLLASERENQESEVLEDCRNSGAGNTLGWILCPILEIMGDAAIGMYDEVVEPYLRVNSHLFSNEERAEAVPYAGWQQFRDIANVVFAVFLLVVIFSQLTGAGIDNYGIKRILPKLVIAIVLINLSYLVCMLLVDVSNIVGNGIQNLFDGLGNGLTEKTTLMIPGASPSDGGGGGIATTGGNIVAVGLLAGLASMTGIIWLNPITLFSLLFAALGVVISLVFLFLLLSVRQAAIVVLVVVSPVVVVCNILPNTKSLFDRWVKLFRTLLMVYPIAGLLVGGGNYVSKLLLAVSPDSFPMALTAMVMGIAPIFFLPGVLKDAMAMLGKVGATLNGLGDRAKGLSNRAGSSVLKSEPVKNIDREFQLGRARKTVERLNKKGSLTGFQARKLAANASMLEKEEKDKKAARVFALREKYKGKEFKELSEAATKALDSGNERDSYGLLGAMNYIYGAKQTAGFISGYYGKKENDLVGEGSINRRKSIKGASEIVNANSGILAELKENNKDIADMVASAGMAGDNPQSLADYTRKMANMEERKWLTQDREAIERAKNARVKLEDGSSSPVLRPETAASVLNKAQNPNSSYGGALKGDTRVAMEKFLGEQGYSRDASGTWVPSTSQPAPGGNNANGAGTLNGGRAFDAGSGFNQRQANEWDRQQQSEDQWGG